MKTQEKKCKIIKKYSNRRLYDTEESTYINIFDLFNLVLQEIDFKVIDAKTQEDLTKNTLIQIIVEKESNNFNILPNEFLKQIIKCYQDNGLKNIMPNYLSQAMEIFVQNQNNFKKQSEEYLKNLQDNFTKTLDFQEVTKQSMELYQNGLEMFFKNMKK